MGSSFQISAWAAITYYLALGLSLYVVFMVFGLILWIHLSLDWGWPSSGLVVPSLLTFPSFERQIFWLQKSYDHTIYRMNLLLLITSIS